MDGCYTCRVLRSQLERARALGNMAEALRITNEMSVHYINYHQQREAANSKPVDGLAALLFPGAREAK